MPSFWSDQEVVAAAPPTEEEMRDVISRFTATFNQIVNSARARGDMFLVSSGGVVHTIDCWTMRHEVDLSSMEVMQGTHDEVRDNFLRGGPPMLPWMESRSELTAHPRRRCGHCAPDVPEGHTRGKFVPTTRAETIGSEHLGRTVDGRTLTRIHIERSNIALHFADGSFESLHPGDRVAFDPKSATKTDNDES